MRKTRRSAGSLGLLVVLIALTHVFPTPAVAGSATRSDGTWESFQADRERLLEKLAPPFVDCFKRRDSAVDPLSPIFHGCIDWHSAVHAAYSHHVLFRRTHVKRYLRLVEEQMSFNGIDLVPAEELYQRAKAPDFTLGENPYGFGWFLILAREREQSAGRKEFRSMADFAAEQMVAWYETRATRGDAATYILNRAHPNYSWSLINLDVWARYTKDKKLLRAVRKAAKPLLDKALDKTCPLKLDTSPKAQGFQPACLMRLAAVAHIQGDAATEWVAERVPNDLHIGPVKKPSGCHAGGLNFTRAFALYQLYRVTGNTTYRDNYADLIRYHVGRPDLYKDPSYLGNPGYLCYSHWVAQMGVRAISLSYD